MKVRSVMIQRTGCSMLQQCLGDVAGECPSEKRGAENPVITPAITGRMLLWARNGNVGSRPRSSVRVGTDRHWMEACMEPISCWRDPQLRRRPGMSLSGSSLTQPKYLLLSSSRFRVSPL